MHMHLRDDSGAQAAHEDSGTPYWRQVALGGRTGAAQRHAKSQETRRAILEAAAALFAEADFRAVSLATIAERAGVPKGSLTFYFSTKLDLARAVVEEMRLRWEAICTETDGRGLAPLDALIAEVDHVLEVSFIDPIIFGGYRLTQDLQVTMAQDATHYVLAEERILGFLSTAAAAGDLRPDLDLNAATRLIAAVITGHGVIHARHPDRAPLQQRTSEAWALILPAIRR